MSETDQARERRFDTIFSAHLRVIADYCRWRSRTVSDADDAVSEVFLTLWRRLDEVEDGDAARMWLYATARRITANNLRAGRRRTGLIERIQALPVAPAFEEAHDQDDPTSELVHTALAAVRPMDREVLLLTEWEGLSPSEIAVVMGCTQGSARGRLHRARRRFRDAFETVASDSAHSHTTDLISAANAPTEFRPPMRTDVRAVERLVSERGCI